MPRGRQPVNFVNPLRKEKEQASASSPRACLIACSRSAPHRRGGSGRVPGSGFCRFRKPEAVPSPAAARVQIRCQHDLPALGKPFQVLLGRVSSHPGAAGHLSDVQRRVPAAAGCLRAAHSSTSSSVFSCGVVSLRSGLRSAASWFLSAVSR